MTGKELSPPPLFELREFAGETPRWCWIHNQPYICKLTEKHRHMPFMHIAGFETHLHAIIYGAMHEWNNWPPYPPETPPWALPHDRSNQ